MTGPRLTVIVPAYNLECYIEACLRSVLEQEVDFDYEVIVCDDASTDNTAAVIRRMCGDYPQLKTVFKQENAGLAANMRTLLELASGEYVAYLDGDDIALPGKLQKQVDYLDSHPDCQMVYHESDMFDSETDRSIRYYSQSFYNWSYIPARSTIEHLVRYGTYMQASSVMFRHHDHLDDTVEASCRIILDYPFYILNAGYLKANIDFIPECLGRYRIHDDSFGAQTGRSVNRRKQCCDDIVLACGLAARFGVAEEVINAGIAHHQFAAALYFLFRGEDALFGEYISRSVESGPMFNERHRIAWENCGAPAKLRNLLAG